MVPDDFMIQEGGGQLGFGKQKQLQLMASYSQDIGGHHKSTTSSIHVGFSSIDTVYDWVRTKI